ncbi:rRNA small subunit 7-methylguanosine (m7G) methyltransferase GidB [Lactococcus lactis subsp. lactis]|uniref:Ribosomal RNA small subunit methyltransferase G n=1 Tax=Lactococcus lactis subsp. lactis TaxID=1360 RepID=A0A0V8DYJ8_LACLL|nr:16S rRNA (guanine(527)-N(7))-methyltransferase RsmG [Lactococcus lactis]KSU18463.1 rRNA small subunit 7-methylguanosine (m7G) methyltransferase GidB [Lactococcus lactis subsp. lactis]
MTPDEFLSALAEFDIQLSDKQIKQFERYFELLVEWNEKINLTAITEKNEVYLKHFYDSIAPILYGLITDQPVSILDIGAGAGFPSLPMKIIFPELKVTIIDSLNKRINFLSLLTEELGLENVTLLHGRAEDFGQDTNYRGTFDVVTARAVARLSVLTEFTIPFLKKNGILLSLKAAQFEEELNDAKKAIATLGGKFIKEVAYELPNGDERHVALIEKKKETPKKYPRKAGTPAKNPIK